MAHNLNNEDNSVEQANQPRLCDAGCGFFANPACGSLCSKCFRDKQQVDESQHANEKAAAKAFGAPLSQAISQLPIPELQAVPESVVSVPGAVPSLLQHAENAPAEVAPALAIEPPSSSQPAVNLESDEPQRPVQKHTNRCFTCNKRVGLTGFKCRCEYVFCGAHRLPEEHHCDFDYKTAGREQLSKNNPLVIPSKLNRV
ncbi:hypothetical protein ABBQ32_013141 [Trebouxia sp. C0010 RCD-2024]